MAAGFPIGLEQRKAKLKNRARAHKGSNHDTCEAKLWRDVELLSNMGAVFDIPTER